MKRLANIIQTDVEAHLNEVMTEKWLHADDDEDNDAESDGGNQVQVAIVTTEDYLNDLLRFLNPFWSRKVKEVVFESLTIRYCRSLLFYTPSRGDINRSGREYSPFRKEA